jgi:hypothetical protein
MHVVRSSLILNTKIRKARQSFVNTGNSLVRMAGLITISALVYLLSKHCLNEWEVNRLGPRARDRDG